MSKHWPLLTWWGLVTLMANIPILATWIGPALTPSEWAAWVQAVGSVAAIIASVLLAIALPHHQQVQAHKALQARLVLAVFNASHELAGFAGAAQGILKAGKINNGTYPHIAASVRAHEADMMTISPIDLPSSARIYLIAIKASANIILTLLDHAHTELGHGRTVESDYFDQVVESTLDDERKIQEYMASRPIGQTPMIGYH